ncbi:hypothetical protein ACRS5S_15170 [Nocardia asiatica]|uniref:hypothetical protein n=1 Tax=Nocardia asiatica TaxID=209252 RepID=UPI0024581CA4|nr:hypothetical protein [Nocardia asiatica]
MALRPGPEPGQALAAAPERAVRLVRGLFDGDRALRPADARARTEYEREVRSID